MWELVQKEGWVPKNWCFWLVVLEKTLESLLESKQIKPVSSKGNQPWIFTGRTEAEDPVLWPPDVKSWLLGKDPDAGKDWEQEDKGVTEDEMVGWHYQLHGHEFEQVPGNSKYREVWHATVYGVTKSQKGISNWTIMLFYFFFFFLRKLHAVFHSGCINLHSNNYIWGFLFFHILTNGCYFLTF